MKKLLVATFLLIVLSPVRAQDKIVLINGDTIVSKVVRITGGVMILDQDGIEQELNIKFVAGGVRANGSLLPIKGHVRKIFWTLDDVNTLDETYTEVLEREADMYFGMDRKIEVPNPKPQSNWADETLEEKRKIVMFSSNAYLVLQKPSSMVLYFKTSGDVSKLVGNYYQLDLVKVVGRGYLEVAIANQKKYGLYFTPERAIGVNPKVDLPFSVKDGVWNVESVNKKGVVSYTKYFVIAVTDTGVKLSRIEEDVVCCERLTRINKETFNMIASK